MSIIDRPPGHLTADDLPGAPLSITDMRDIVCETLAAFLDGHTDLADRNVTVTPAQPPYAGLIELAVGDQAFAVTIAEPRR